MSKAIIPLSGYFSTLKGEPTGVEFIVPTSIKICHNLRIPRHKTLTALPNEAKELWDGFMDLYFISSLITKQNC
jgi:hypothetical protein